MGLETEGGGEEIGSSKVGGDEGGVCLATADTWERRKVYSIAFAPYSD